MPKNTPDLEIKKEILSYLIKTPFDEIRLSKKEKKTGQTTMTRILLIQEIEALKDTLPENSSKTLNSLDDLKKTIEALPLSKSPTDIVKSLLTMSTIIEGINKTLNKLFTDIKEENVALDTKENEPFDKVMKSTRFLLCCVQCVLEGIPSSFRWLAGQSIRGAQGSLNTLQDQLKNIYHEKFKPENAEDKIVGEKGDAPTMQKSH